MLFTAPSFLFLFLPLLLAIYALLPQHYRRYAILLFNVIFLLLCTHHQISTLLLALATAAFTYSAGFAIAVTHRRKTVLGASVVLLIVFFGLRLFHAYSLAHGPHFYPLGATMMLLSSLSYLMDIYRSDAPHAKNFAELLIYLFFFPTAIIGPIIRYKRFCNLLDEIDFSLENFGRGVQTYMAGFIKRIGIAAILCFMHTRMLAGYGEEIDLLSAILALVLMLAELWFSIHGYVDMARGLLLMLGIACETDSPNPGEESERPQRRAHCLNSFVLYAEDYWIAPILRNNRISEAMRQLLAAGVMAVFAAMLIKTRWYMLIPAMLMMALYFTTIRTGVTEVSAPSRSHRIVRTSLSLLTLLIFWCFALIESPAQTWSILGKIQLQPTPELSDALYSVSAYGRYLLVGAIGLFAALPLHATSGRYLNKLSHPLQMTLCTASMLIFMGAFVFTILQFTPQFPQYAATPFNHIVI
ncbi:MAG: hypothetical protein IKD37_07980 [Clostridia bacterium]|nr:hypothetical protein [Clostridia bacterium]